MFISTFSCVLRSMPFIRPLYPAVIFSKLSFIHFSDGLGKFLMGELWYWGGAGYDNNNPVSEGLGVLMFNNS